MQEVLKQIKKTKHCVKSITNEKQLIWLPSPRSQWKLTLCIYTFFLFIFFTFLADKFCDLRKLEDGKQRILFTAPKQQFENQQLYPSTKHFTQFLIEIRSYLEHVFFSTGCTVWLEGTVELRLCKISSSQIPSWFITSIMLTCIMLVSQHVFYSTGYIFRMNFIVECKDQFSSVQFSSVQIDGIRCLIVADTCWYMCFGGV